jgi:hypothetical protein
VVRSVASFANMPDGGTLVLGVVEENRVATEITGFEHPADPAQSADQAIRNGVAPIPQYTNKAIQLKEGRWCLVVEVPTGLEPPYIHVQSGSVLVRTGTSSEPVHINDRQELDRLYNQGRRGRDWAVTTAETLVTAMTSPGLAQVWTIPAVEGGLPPHSEILKASFLDRLKPHLREPMPVSWEQDAHHGPTSVVFRKHEGDYSSSISVDVNGTISTTWHDKSSAMPLSTVESLVQQVLPQHEILLVKEFGYRGSIALALVAAGVPRIGQVNFTRLVEVQQLADNTFHESVIRHLNRFTGHPVFEPE